MASYVSHEVKRFQQGLPATVRINNITAKNWRNRDPLASLEYFWGFRIPFVRREIFDMYILQRIRYATYHD